MTYPAVPSSLDTADQVMAWLKQLQTKGFKFSEELTVHSKNGTLTVETASEALDRFTWFLAAVDKAYEALEELAVDFDVEDALSDMADASHEFGDDMSKLVFNRLRELGVNANILLKEAQDRHYP